MAASAVVCVEVWVFFACWVFWAFDNSVEVPVFSVEEDDGWGFDVWVVGCADCYFCDVFEWVVGGAVVVE